MFIYDLKLQDKYNTCALSKHIGKYVYSARNAGKGSALCLAFFPIPKPHTYIYIYASRVYKYCTMYMYINLCNISRGSISLCYFFHA